MHTLPWLVADIGGTNMRLGRMLSPHGPITDKAQIKTPRSGDLATALAPYLDQFQTGRPRIAALAVAGPIVDDTVQLTNSGAYLDRARACQSLGLDDMLLVNDLAAVAAALPLLQNSQVKPLGIDLPRKPNATLLVVGAGTGCGVAATIWTGDRWHAVASEAGHMTFSPRNDLQAKLEQHISIKALGRPGARVSYDRVLAGSGLLACGEVVAADMSAPVPSTAEAITKAAAGGDPCGQAACALFADVFAAGAGEFALAFLALGGVYFVGSIAASVASYLDTPTARFAFNAPGRQVPLLNSIPMRLVIDTEAPLIGLGARLSHP